MTQETYGEILFKGINSGATPPEYVYTPWAPCRGDRAVFAIQIIKITSGLTLSWDIETKSSEDPDADALPLMSVDQSETSVGVKYSLDGGANPKELKGCKEWYRFRFATGNSYSAAEYVNFRVLQPAWALDGK